MRTATIVSFNVPCRVHATRDSGDAPQLPSARNDATTLLSDVACASSVAEEARVSSPICSVRMTSIVPRFRRSLKCQSQEHGWLHWSLRWHRGHHAPFAPELAQKHRVFRRLLRRVRAASPRALSACLLGSFSDTRAIWV